MFIGFFSEHQGTSCCSLFAQRDEEKEGNEKHGEGRGLTGTQEVLGGFGVGEGGRGLGGVGGALEIN